MSRCRCHGREHCADCQADACCESIEVVGSSSRAWLDAERLRDGIQADYQQRVMQGLDRLLREPVGANLAPFSWQAEDSCGTPAPGRTRLPEVPRMLTGVERQPMAAISCTPDPLSLSRSTNSMPTRRET
jgi:hypothetical protein